jgi:pheromone shutdown-related protein TraB
LIERITIKDKEIVIVGTAHISEKSVEEVKEAIAKEKPDVVGVELCSQRLAQLRAGKKWQETNISEIIKTGRTYIFLLNLLLSSIQRKLGLKVGVKPGAEMLIAMKTAQENDLPVALLDRNVSITLKRALSMTSFMEKIRLVFAVLAGFFVEEEILTPEKIEALKRKDIMTELMEELSRTAPTLKKVLVDERDAFIAQRIMSAPGKKIVAVVGAGHVAGIKKWLTEKIDLRPLQTVPKKTNWLKGLAYLVPVIFVVMLAYAFLIKGFGASLEIFGWWFLINGVLSALGVLIARGHPLTIITAFLAAPFTSLHPAFAAGWFAAAAETKFNMPKVKDFESLNKLESYGDFTKNRVTRILMVAAFANVGSTIGTVIALPYILSLLA